MLRRGIIILIIFTLSISLVLGVDGTTNTPLTSSNLIDTDGDGVIDERDVCPETTSNIIVDPFENLNYAGCSCEQVNELITSLNNSCIKITFCFESTIAISYNALESKRVTCPEESCEVSTFTYIVYPVYGNIYCQEGKLVNSCEPILYPNATICGYIAPVIEQEENITLKNTTNETIILKDSEIIPELTKNEIEPIQPDDPSLLKEEITNNYYLSEAEIVLAYPEKIIEGDKATLQLRFVTEQKRIDIDPQLYAPTGELILLKNATCEEDENATLICMGMWDLPTDKIVEENLVLIIDYTGTDGKIIQEELSILINVREKPFTAEPAKEAIIGKDITQDDPQLTPREEILIKSIYEEYMEQEEPIITNVDTFIEKIIETAKHVIVEKETDYDVMMNITVVTLSIIPKEGIIATNVSVIEYIPKEIAEDVSEIYFSTNPTKILNDDPLVMWHFAVVEEKVDLSYEILGEAEITGNTIVVANELKNKQSPWFIILPMLMIPLLVILLVVVPRMVHNHEYHE